MKNAWAGSWVPLQRPLATESMKAHWVTGGGGRFQGSCGVIRMLGILHWVNCYWGEPGRQVENRLIYCVLWTHTTMATVGILESTGSTKPVEFLLFLQSHVWNTCSIRNTSVQLAFHNVRSLHDISALSCVCAIAGLLETVLGKHCSRDFLGKASLDSVPLSDKM